MMSNTFGYLVEITQSQKLIDSATGGRDTVLELIDDVLSALDETEANDLTNRASIFMYESQDKQVELKNSDGTLEIKLAVTRLHPDLLY